MNDSMEAVMKTLGFKRSLLPLLLSCTLGLLLLITACNLQAASGGQTAIPQVDQIVQQTFAAMTRAAGGPVTDPSMQETRIAFAVEQTVAAMPSSTPQFTPTLTVTPTPGIVRVTVSMETNCRTGPGPAYETLGILRVGQTAEVVGRNFINDTWIIKLPSNPAITCWVWGGYSTVSGNWEALPIIKTPPTPTPTKY